MHQRIMARAAKYGAMVALTTLALSACASDVDILQAEANVQAARSELAQAQAAGDQARIDDAGWSLYYAKRNLEYVRMNWPGERNGVGAR